MDDNTPLALQKALMPVVISVQAPEDVLEEYGYVKVLPHDRSKTQSATVLPQSLTGTMLGAQAGVSSPFRDGSS